MAPDFLSHLNQSRVREQQLSRGNFAPLSSNYRSNSPSNWNQESLPSLSNHPGMSVAGLPTSFPAISPLPYLSFAPDIVGTSLRDPSRNSAVPRPTGDEASQRSVNKRIRKRNGGTNRFHCTEKNCDKSFARKYDLQKHRDVVHLKRKIHSCQRCTSRFGRKGSLTKHIRSVHEKLKPHVCSHCGRKFSEHGNLNKHIRCAHDAKRTIQRESAWELHYQYR